MKKLHYLVAAACVCAAAGSFAEEQVSRTEKTVTRTESANGSSRVTKTVTTTVNTYVDQLRTVYRTAGIPADLVDRLVELDRRIYQAYVAGDWVTVRRLRIEQRQLLSPDQVTKVYTYFQSHPLPADIAPIATYTFVPQQQFETHIVRNESGRIEPGVLSVPGVAATATFQGSGTQAAPSGTSEIRTNSTVAPSESTTIKSDTDVDTRNPAVGTSEIRSGTETAPSGSTTIKSDSSQSDMDSPNATELKTESPSGQSSSDLPNLNSSSSNSGSSNAGSSSNSGSGSSSGSSSQQD